MAATVIFFSNIKGKQTLFLITYHKYINYSKK